jgi:hypothetical protein
MKQALAPDINQVRKQASMRGYLIGWYTPQTKGGAKAGAQLADAWIEKNQTRLLNQ